jgi:hypothetical protein
VTIGLAQVKAVLIVNRSEVAYLLVGGASADEWHLPFGAAGDRMKVMPHSPLLLVHSQGGWPVSAGYTALKLAAVGGDATFDIAILGVR